MVKFLPKHLGIKLLIISLCCGFVLSWVVLKWPCPFRRFFHIPCPTCGMSRAWLAALQLDLNSAFRFHPMFWSVPIFVLFILYDGCLFMHKKMNAFVLIALLAAYFACYAVRIVAYLSGSVSF